MTSSATKGAGALLKKGSTTIAEVTSIGGPNLTRETFDVTHMQSTWHDFIAGLPDAGELSLDLNFLPANTTHTLLHNDMTATAQTYNLLFTDTGTTTWTMTALVTGLSPVAAVDAELTATATFKLSGAVTFS